MGSQERYFIGEKLREKLRDTFARVDSMPYGGSVTRIPTELGGDVPSTKIFRVCEADGAWPVNTSKSVRLVGITSTPNTVSVLNRIVSLPAPYSTATSRIVTIGKDGGQWNLISFQMATATAVFGGATQTMTVVGATSKITFLSAGSTRTITYAEPGSDVSVVTNISASLNTADCNITVTKTTANIKTVGASQTATVVSLAGTQTAAVVSVAGTQTVTTIAATYTATYIRLEI